MASLGSLATELLDDIFSYLDHHTLFNLCTVSKYILISAENVLHTNLVLYVRMSRGLGGPSVIASTAIVLRLIKRPELAVRVRSVHLKSPGTVELAASKISPSDYRTLCSAAERVGLLTNSSQFAQEYESRGMLKENYRWYENTYPPPHFQDIGVSPIPAAYEFVEDMFAWRLSYKDSDASFMLLCSQLPNLEALCMERALNGRLSWDALIQSPVGHQFSKLKSLTIKHNDRMSLFGYLFLLQLPSLRSLNVKGFDQLSPRLDLLDLSSYPWQPRSLQIQHMSCTFGAPLPSHTAVEFETLIVGCSGLESLSITGDPRLSWNTDAASSAAHGAFERILFYHKDTLKHLGLFYMEQAGDWGRQYSQWAGLPSLVQLSNLSSIEIDSHVLLGIASFNLRKFNACFPSSLEIFKLRADAPHRESWDFLPMVSDWISAGITDGLRKRLQKIHVVWMHVSVFRTRVWTRKRERLYAYFGGSPQAWFRARGIELAEEGNEPFSLEISSEHIAASQTMETRIGAQHAYWA